MKLKKISKIKLYSTQYIHKNLYEKKVYYKLFFFYLYMHKKLNYFNFLYKNKFFNYSNGQLFRNKIKNFKSFKKSKKSISMSINILTKKLHKKNKFINLFFCKNFNYKNYSWIKKFLYLIKPQINKMVFTNNWQYVFKKKRRIKKKIYKTLLINSKVV